jgi:transcriptional regulator with XRE-family HTH domain
LENVDLDIKKRLSNYGFDICSAAMPNRPINVAAGALVRDLRSRRRVSIAEAAEAFGVSAAYLRAIESGSQAIPAYAVFGLTRQLGMRWDEAAGLVATIAYLNRDGAEDHRKVWERANQLATETGLKGHSGLAKALNTIPGSAEDHQQVGEGVLVQLQATLTDGGLSSSRPIEDAEGARALPRGLNPVFRDILLGFIESATTLQPAITEKFVRDWESKNRNRITHLLGYVHDEETLFEGLETFDWPFLESPLRPDIRIVVRRGLKRYTPEQMIQRLAKKSRAFETDRGIARLRAQIQFVDAPPDLEEMALAHLTFDYATREMAPDESDAAKVSYLKAGRYRVFQNVWLYKLLPQSGRRGEDSEQTVSYMDMYDLDTRASYGVSLSDNHGSAWIRMFDEILSRDNL